MPPGVRLIVWQAGHRRSHSFVSPAVSWMSSQARIPVPHTTSDVVRHGWPDVSSRRAMAIAEVEAHVMDAAGTMVAALVREDTLRVFAAVIMSTGLGEPVSDGNTITVAHITSTGVVKVTGLPLDVVRRELRRLVTAGLARRDGDRDSWRTNLPAMLAAASG